VDDVDGVFGTRVLVYHIQLERLGAIVEGRPGHGNGKKVAEVQASMSRFTQLAFSEGSHVFASPLALCLSLFWKFLQDETFYAR